MEKVANFAKFAHALGYSVKSNSPNQVSRAFSALLKKAEGKPESAILQQLAIRTMAKAAYTTDNIGHYGLAFETYTHFTSPIRRYADVLSHRILWDYLQGRNAFSVKPQELEELCVHISRKERKAMEAERESIKYKQAEFLVEHIGEIFQGVISGIAEHGVYVELKDNFCEGMVRYDNMYDNFQMVNNFMIHSKWQDYKMGDLVWVRILNAEPQRRQIDMELLDPKGAEVKEISQLRGIELPLDQAQGKVKTGGTVLPNTHLMELDLPQVEEDTFATPSKKAKKEQKQAPKKDKGKKSETQAKAVVSEQPAPKPPVAEEKPAAEAKPKRSPKTTPKAAPTPPVAEEKPAAEAKPKRGRSKKDQPPTA
jgi:predicted RNA-binding protein with RPS1 domain